MSGWEVWGSPRLCATYQNPTSDVANISDLAHEITGDRAILGLKSLVSVG